MGKINGAWLALFAASWMGAQSTPDRVVIPVRNGARPPVIKASLVNAGITVQTHGGSDVIVESQPGRHSHRHEDVTKDGLHRLDLPGSSGLDVTEEAGVVTIRAGLSHGGLLITVPVNSSLNLRCVNGGDIRITGVHGELDVENVNGRVDLENVSGTVVASTINGSLRAAMDQVDPGKPVSFSTLNGPIDVTLPGDLRALLKMKTDNGEIYSDFDVQMDLSNRGTITENNHTGDGRYRVRVDRTVVGRINGGGVQASFTTTNGRISIRKKK